MYCAINKTPFAPITAQQAFRPDADMMNLWLQARHSQTHALKTRLRASESAAATLFGSVACFRTSLSASVEIWLPLTRKMRMQVRCKN